jgi:hypothetical protein
MNTVRHVDEAVEVEISFNGYVKERVGRTKRAGGSSRATMQPWAGDEEEEEDMREGGALTLQGYTGA